MREVVGRLWPGTFLPGIRSRVGRLLTQTHRLSESIQFRFWRTYSRTRFGESRLIEAHGHIFSVRSDDRRAFVMWRTHGTQKDKIQIWSELVGPNVICVDVGANYGEFAATAASKGAVVIAIEPNPLLVHCLRWTMHRYPSAEVVEAIASDVEETKTLYFNPTSMGSGSLSSVVPSSGRRRSKSSVVTASQFSRRLDRLVPELIGGYPDLVLLKIDVEGFEEEVLKGARGLIDAARSWRAIVEFNESAIRRAGKDPRLVWNGLREFAGVVVNELATIGPELGTELPDEPNLVECDVVIGKGNWEHGRGARLP